MWDHGICQYRYFLYLFLSGCSHDFCIIPEMIQQREKWNKWYPDGKVSPFSHFSLPLCAPHTPHLDYILFSQAYNACFYNEKKNQTFCFLSLSPKQESAPTIYITSALQIMWKRSNMYRRVHAEQFLMIWGEYWWW